MSSDTDRGGNPLVSIIVTLNDSGEQVERCIAALATLSYRPVEFIIVDNGSEDDSLINARRAADRFGIDAIISGLGYNAGVASARNNGENNANGEILFFVDPSTQVHSDTLDPLVQVLDDVHVGVAGCKARNLDGTIYHAGGYVDDNGIKGHYGDGEEDTGQYETPWQCDFVTGGAMAIKRDLFQRIGGFDRCFHPDQYEDVDLCTRVRRLGLGVIYVPQAKVWHFEPLKGGRGTDEYLVNMHRNRIRFMLKNYSWRFLLDRALPQEQLWLESVKPWEHAVPLNRGYLINIAMLPEILRTRRRMEYSLKAPRIEDTV